tara:strand:+ start:256 stop:453 length:198 start_codon:yes stop_codon:yes gene_type:complete
LGVTLPDNYREGQAFSYTCLLGGLCCDVPIDSIVSVSHEVFSIFFEIGFKPKLKLSTKKVKTIDG